MKNLCDPMIDKFRDHEADRFYQTADNERGLGGAFVVPVPGSRTGVTQRSFLRVIASNDDDWDHVSVSLSNRCPTWDEMDYIKRLFFKPDEVCFQLHVADAKHINMMPYCLHIWRPHKAAIPLPPSDMV